MRVKSETAGGEVTTLSRRRPGNAWLVKSSSVSTDCEVIQVCGEGGKVRSETVAGSAAKTLVNLGWFYYVRRRR